MWWHYNVDHCAQFCGSFTIFTVNSQITIWHQIFVYARKLLDVTYICLTICGFGDTLIAKWYSHLLTLEIINCENICWEKPRWLLKLYKTATVCVLHPPSLSLLPTMPVFHFLFFRDWRSFLFDRDWRRPTPANAWPTYSFLIHQQLIQNKLIQHKLIQQKYLSGP